MFFNKYLVVYECIHFKVFISNGEIENYALPHEIFVQTKKNKANVVLPQNI